MNVKKPGGILLRPEERCDCGQPLACRCVSCIVSEYQGEHTECSTCCPINPAQASDRAVQPPTEDETIQQVRNHWWTQGGGTQFGYITGENADEVVASILRVVRRQLPAGFASDRAVQPEAFTENEIKDVLCALYQDGHVDLVLADRIAALMQGLAVGLNQSSMLNTALLKDCRWAIDDKGGDSVYETQCGHNFYFDDSSGTGENGFRFCAYCGGRLVEVKTSEHNDE